jgi:dTMP kinase
MFIVIEGFDGSGKSTAIKHLERLLVQKGYKVHLTREPGGSPVGIDIRNVLLNGHDMLGMTEMLLFMASRYEHIHKVIIPKMKEGYVVISDRFVDSSFAYQAFGRGLENEFEILKNLVVGEFKPDYKIFLNVDFDISQKRLALRTEKQDRLDNEIMEFKLRVHRGYLLAMENSNVSPYEIDANQNIDGVQKQLENLVNNFIPRGIV